MNSAEFKAFAGLMDLKPSWLAKQFGVEVRAVNHWMDSKQPPDDVQDTITHLWHVFTDIVMEQTDNITDKIYDGELITLVMVQDTKENHSFVPLNLSSIPDDTKLPMTMWNAIIRQVAFQLTLEEYEVEVIYR